MLKMDIHLRITRDDTDAFKQKVRSALVPATRAFLQEYHSKLMTAVTVQDVPGPSLKPATVRRKRRMLRKLALPIGRATDKWLLEDKAIAQSFILASRVPRGAKAALMPPTDGSRPNALYHLLEFRYGRPLFHDTFDKHQGAAMKAFEDALKGAVG